MSSWTPLTTIWQPTSLSTILLRTKWRAPQTPILSNTACAFHALNVACVHRLLDQQLAPNYGMSTILLITKWRAPPPISSTYIAFHALDVACFILGEMLVL